MAVTGSLYCYFKDLLLFTCFVTFIRNLQLLHCVCGNFGDPVEGPCFKRLKQLLSQVYFLINLWIFQATESVHSEAKLGSLHSSGFMKGLCSEALSHVGQRLFFLSSAQRR